MARARTKSGSTLDRLGFKPLSDRKVESVVMSIFGLEGTRKTSLALQAPRPLALLNFDTGIDRAKKPPELDGVFYRDQIVPVGADLQKDDYFRMWKSFEKDYVELCESGEVKSIVIDTATWAWYLVLFALFGRTDQIMPLQYGQANTQWNTIVTAARKAGRTLILVHSANFEYETVRHKKTGKPILDSRGNPKQVKTDTIKRQGCNQTGYQVDIEVGAYKDERQGNKVCGIELLKAHKNDDLVGAKYEGDNCTFSAIVSDCTDTDEEDWK